MQIGEVERQVRRWLMRAFVLLWLAQVGPWGLLLLWPDSDSSRAPAVVVLSYAVYLGWAAMLLWWAGRRPEIGVLPVVAALAVMTAGELLVGFVLSADAVASWQNWTPAPATGVAAFAQVYGGTRWGVGAVAVLGGVYVATGLRDQDFGRAGTLFGVAGQLALFTVVAGLVTAKLLSTARQADAEAEDALRARAAEARVQERVRQYDVLHTHVLTTLTLLARDETALSVVDAVAHAVTEALNNVAKHAGTAEVWVVATGEPNGELVVTVTDHGAGFDLVAPSGGTGITTSMRGRMAEVGGTVVVDSGVGTGTTVEIRWSGPAATPDRTSDQRPT